MLSCFGMGINLNCFLLLFQSRGSFWYFWGRGQDSNGDDQVRKMELVVCDVLDIMQWIDPGQSTMIFSFLIIKNNGR